MESTPASTPWFLGRVFVLPGTQCHAESLVIVRMLYSEGQHLILASKLSLGCAFRWPF